MTQPQLLQVEVEELLARAAELEDPIAEGPAEVPRPPCDFAMTKNAAQQLSLSADNVRLYLAAGEREWRRLAESLRNAANSYQNVDEHAAESINTEGVVALRVCLPPGNSFDPAQLGDTPTVAMADSLAYADLKQRALDNEAGDQGTSFLGFADAWEDHQRTLLEARHRFRPFQHWYSEASHAVEQSFDLQRGWLDQIAALCGKMADQARTVAATQKWAQKEHIWFENTTIRYSDLVLLDEQYIRLPKFRQSIMEIYERLHAQSDEVLAEYRRRAALPLAPLTPPKPPVAHRIGLPPKPDSDFPDYEVPAGGGGVDFQPGNETPLDGALLPNAAGMSNMPAANGPALPDKTVIASDSIATKAAALPTLKSAALGAGGGAGRLPLQPLANGGSAPGNLVRAFEAAELAGAAPGAAAGAMGSGGMGMAPLRGAGGKDPGAGKAGKRAQRDEEALYIEERPWTQGIVGRRRSKDAPDTEEPK
ncbi:EspB family ESX-1 secretion system-associated protein [Mycobacterium camsae]|uniref:PPE domain-containing protein n=1 Tax=Mycobacterium gordonae TaxID=1778 RepID=UPI0019825635|nr:hypothetical protein [Mycobacterium gordonae]